MSRLAGFSFLVLLIVGCSASKSQSLYPKHIETPNFPPIARAAHVTGKVWLTVTVDADGNVKTVEAKAENPVQQAHPLLQKYAIENMEHWKFMKPPAGLSKQVILYDYEFDPSLPGEGGPSDLPAITKVNFDLPDHVAIWANLRFIDVSQSAQHD
jgi:TonB family protein